MPRPPLPTSPADQLAHVDETLVKDFTDSGSYSRGRTYFRQGHIHDTVLRERTLTALCEGSDYEPYRVEVTLGFRGEAKGAILDYGCTCPRGGFCKHIVAMLLAWIDEPSRFAALPPLAEALANRSRDELVTLVVQMVKRHPDLERMLELLPPPAAVQADTPANVATQDPATIRRHARVGLRSFTNYEYEWGNPPVVSPELEGLVELGRQHVAAGRWADAQVVFCGIAEEITDIYLEISDDEGELSGVLSMCDEGLASCIDAQAELPEGDRLDPAQREDLIRAGYDLWSFDVFDAGGLDFAGAAIDAIAKHATPEERAMVEQWLDAEKPASDWTRRSLVAVRVLLREAAGADDEELLALYRDAGLWEEMAVLLLERDRVEDAVAIARNHLRQPHSFLAFATALAERGADGAATAISLVEDRSWEEEKRDAHADAQYQGWLIGSYRAQGNAETALTLATRRFMRQPAHRFWNDVREIATQAGQPASTWEELRPKLLARLREVREWSTLIEIFLDEGDVAAAFDAFDHSRANTRRGTPLYQPWWGAETQEIRLAKAGERQFPDRAMAIYRQHADRMIAHRGRERYKIAADYLARVRNILERENRTGEWTELIGTIRTEHRNLPALRDELDKAGLK